MPRFISEFKKFAMRGNMLDMTVGIVIGGGFGKIVTSLVNDIIMPPLGFLIGGVDFKNLKILLKPEQLATTGEVTVPAVSFNYGLFIQNVIDFLIVAIAVFIMVRLVNRISKKSAVGEKETESVPAAPPRQEALLEEIRDLLKNK